jgi:hypothetical protein
MSLANRISRTRWRASPEYQARFFVIADGRSIDASVLSQFADLHFFPPPLRTRQLVFDLKLTLTSSMVT